MDVLTISLGRNILKSGSRERLRMHGYAEHLHSLHIIVLTRTCHGFTSEVHEGNLHLYPTNSLCRPMMLIDAFFKGRKIIQKEGGRSFIVSAQDPLEIGWFSWFLTMLTHTHLHVQVHGDYFSSPAWVGRSILRYVRRALALHLLRGVSEIRVVSERIKKSLIARGIEKDRITVLPIRPELEAFLQINRPTPVSSRCSFLYVGRLAEEKDIFRIVDAFKMLYATTPTVRLRIVGDGEEKADVLDFIKKEHLDDVITLIPWTEDVPSCMAEADVFLTASKHEAYGLTIVEAMASGLPVVTTDVGCVGEVFTDGIHGIVVREVGLMPYVHAMEKMAHDESFRTTCGMKGRQTVATLVNDSPEGYIRAWVDSMARAVRL
jgi:glycosyltransferase involved in cell wall biosynthesis